ncbi:3-keto-steroid reductase [Aspergillus nanangensis]|uniref:3-keto-steroid reductase n=1 Tax=Aspergillus nanangensis TaxID=2582783 RepID=A0AAD4CK43_ASPNN|nr:3-keto-steroid reductase [Aspergillus nanangensis]
MANSATPADSQNRVFILVTGANRKGNDTLRRLQDHLRSSTAPSASDRITFMPENVDLTNLLSVRALSRRLTQSLPKLDAIVLNAGLGGWTGINWPVAIWGVLTDLIHQVSWPSYKVAPAGVVTSPQTTLSTEGEEEPRLGSIFCANVFGHYMLAHNVMRLLRRSSSPQPGRVIWVSSLEGTAHLFDPSDLQGLQTYPAYESSKALTDILALTADLPSSAPWVKSFYAVDDNKDTDTTTTTISAPAVDSPPNMYLSHPGICGTGILPLSLPLFYAMIAAFWLARLLGSPWHTLSTYAGAVAPVWLALSPQADLADAEATYREHGGGRAKWGSSCDRLGRDSPASTEVDGWGYGGVVGPAVVDADQWRRRKRGAEDLTREEKERFEELGRTCWQRMEELRIQWDRILDRQEALPASST